MSLKSIDEKLVNSDFPVLKSCEVCGDTMRRKRFENRVKSRLETASEYSKRRTCVRNECKYALLHRSRRKNGTAPGHEASAEEVIEISRVFAGRLATLRLNAGLSQARLAKRLGISMQLYSAWECGRVIGSMKFVWLVRLAMLYDLSVAQLIGDISPRFATEPNSPQQAQAGFLTQWSPAIGDHSRCSPGSVFMCSECKDLWRESIREAV